MNGDLTDAFASLAGDADETPDDHDAVLARRLDVVTRLLQRGMPLRVIEALLPGWDDAIRGAVRTEPPAA